MFSTTCTAPFRKRVKSADGRSPVRVDRGDDRFQNREGIERKRSSGASFDSKRSGSGRTSGFVLAPFSEVGLSPPARGAGRRHRVRPGCTGREDHVEADGPRRGDVTRPPSDIRRRGDPAGLWRTRGHGLLAIILPRCRRRRWPSRLPPIRGCGACPPVSHGARCGIFFGSLPIYAYA